MDAIQRIRAVRAAGQVSANGILSEYNELFIHRADSKEMCRRIVRQEYRATRRIRGDLDQNQQPACNMPAREKPDIHRHSRRAKYRENPGRNIEGDVWNAHAESGTQAIDFP